MRDRWSGTPWLASPRSLFRSNFGKLASGEDGLLGEKFYVTNGSTSHRRPTLALVAVVLFSLSASITGQVVEHAKGPRQNEVAAMNKLGQPSANRLRSRAWSWWSRVPPAIRHFFFIDVALVAAYLVNLYAIGRFQLLTLLLDLDAEGSVPSWYSSVQLFLVGMLLATLAVHIPGRPDKVRLWFAAALFFFLSKEENFGIHELIGGRIARHMTPEAHASSFFRYSTAWPVLLGPPLLIAMLVLGWRAAGLLRGRPHVILKYIVGLVVFLGGAVGLEIIWNLLPLWGTAHRAEIVAEEFLEMAGVTFFLWASYDLLSSYGIRLVAGTTGEETRG